MLCIKITVMRTSKLLLVEASLKATLNTLDEVVNYIVKYSGNTINLNCCTITCSIDFRKLFECLESTRLGHFIEKEEYIALLGNKSVRYIVNLPVYCEGVWFKHEAFWNNITFKKSVTFIGASFDNYYCFDQSVFEGIANFALCDFEFTSRPLLTKDSFSNTEFMGYANFNEAIFKGVANFMNSKFARKLCIRNAEFAELDFYNIKIEENFELEGYFSAKIYKVSNQVTGLFLKQYAIKKYDSIATIRFKQLEMEAYTRYLYKGKIVTLDIPSSQNNFVNTILNLTNLSSNIILLKLNSWSNKHGSSWTRGCIFTFIAAFIFYSLFYLTNKEIYFTMNITSWIIWDASYWKDILIFMWLPSGLKPIDMYATNISLWGCIWFMLGKIFVAYGIYQTISAFRKYGKI